MSELEEYAGVTLSGIHIYSDYHSVVIHSLRDGLFGYSLHNYEHLCRLYVPVKMFIQSFGYWLYCLLACVVICTAVRR